MYQYVWVRVPPPRQIQTKFNQRRKMMKQEDKMLAETKTECEHEMDYITKSSDVTFYDDSGNDYYIDVALYKCNRCGDLEVTIY